MQNLQFVENLQYYNKMYTERDNLLGIDTHAVESTLYEINHSSQVNFSE